MRAYCESPGAIKDIRVEYGGETSHVCANCGFQRVATGSRPRVGQDVNPAVCHEGSPCKPKSVFAEGTPPSWGCFQSGMMEIPRTARPRFIPFPIPTTVPNRWVY